MCVIWMSACFNETHVMSPDGQTLPMTMRQLLSPDGTLTVKGVDRIIDAGKYSCIATNKQGHSDRKETQLHVVGKCVGNERVLLTLAVLMNFRDRSSNVLVKVFLR